MWRNLKHVFKAQLDQHFLGSKTDKGPVKLQHRRIWDLARQNDYVEDPPLCLVDHQSSVLDFIWVFGHIHPCVEPDVHETVGINLLNVCGRPAFLFRWECRLSRKFRVDRFDILNSVRNAAKLNLQRVHCSSVQSVRQSYFNYGGDRGWEEVDLANFAVFEYKN